MKWSLEVKQMEKGETVKGWYECRRLTAVPQTIQNLNSKFYQTDSIKQISLTVNSIKHSRLHTLYNLILKLIPVG